MTTVVFHHGDKGGVGKTHFCKTYIDAKLGEKDNLVIVEADTRNPDIGWVYGKILPVHHLDLRNKIDEDGQDTWMAFGDLIENNPGKEIIVNLPAGVGAMIAKNQEFFGQIIKTLKAKVRMYFSIDRQKTSLAQLAQAADAAKSFMDLKDLTIIQNGFYGPSAAHFREWEKSKIKKELEKEDVKVVYISELHFRVMETIEYRPFTVALEEGLKLSERITLEQWLKEARSALEVA